MFIYGLSFFVMTFFCENMLQDVSATSRFSLSPIIIIFFLEF